MDELDLTDAEKKATYQEIKDYVLEHSGLKVSSLYIAQVKQKYGIIERDCYNKPKSADAKQPKCPLNKEKAIMEALKHIKQQSHNMQHHSENQMIFRGFYSVFIIGV